MKKFTPYVFGTAALVAALSGGTTVQAQTNTQSRTVIISKNDTLVNGKKIGDISKSERAQLLKDIRDIKSKLGEPAEPRRMVIEREMVGAYGSGQSAPSRTRVYIRSKDDSLHTKSWSFNSDSIRNMRVKILRDSNLTVITSDSILAHLKGPIALAPPLFERQLLPGRPSAVSPRISINGRGLSRNNSQSFSYSTTDKDGVYSHMNIRLSETDKATLKKITGTETAAELPVDDLTIFPNFSSGKLTFSFNVATKGNTEIKILDSDARPLFSDKKQSFTGSYLKQIALPRNGVYYVAVNQNGKWFARKMVKE